MKRILLTTAAVLCANSALAGGVERSPVSPLILFEDGRYAELSFGSVNASISGVLGVDSGDVAPTYSIVNGGYKWDYGGKVDVALVFGQAYGADVDYGNAATGYPLGGSNATLSSLGVTALAKYELDGGVSVYGGVTSQSLEMDVSLTGGYTASGSNTREFGYIAGVAYERPEIALRVALTYQSSIDFEIDTLENSALASVTDVTLPQSITLDFQSGIAQDTLIFGSIRQVNWSDFDISPVGFAAGNGGASLVSYDDNTTTYNLGLGRRFTDEWSGAVTVAYEASGGTPVGNLGPTDGRTAVGLGGTYTSGNMEVTGGVQYIMIGDATTTIGAQFDDNTALAFGLKLGFSL